LKISPCGLCICGGTNPPHPQFYAPEGRGIKPLVIKKVYPEKYIAKIIQLLQTTPGIK
jgi:hypothetical protein